MIRALAFSVLLTAFASSAAWAASADNETGPDRFHNVDSVEADVEDYLQYLQRTLALAERGVLGRVSRGNMAALRRSSDQIEALLSGYSHTNELSPEQVVQLQSSHGEFIAIVRDYRENSLVCEQVSRPGTRLTTKRCMTVAERERARLAARDTADQIIRQPSCVSEGSASSC